MTFRHLEIFIAVADLGSMTRASRQLFISQPTVSQAIAELENHSGFPGWPGSNKGLFRCFTKRYNIQHIS